MMNKFSATFDYKLIYVFRINEKTHKGLLKIGDATIHTETPINTLLPNSRELNNAAKNQINSYILTAGITYELLYTELATRKEKVEGIEKEKSFRDYKVHNVLIRSKIKKHNLGADVNENEWFKMDLEIDKKSIKAAKDGQ